jgi:hypothetical protein
VKVGFDELDALGNCVHRDEATEASESSILGCVQLYCNLCREEGLLKGRPELCGQIAFQLENLLRAKTNISFAKT